MQFLNSANICEQISEDRRRTPIHVIRPFYIWEGRFCCVQLDSIKMILIFLIFVMHTFQLMNFRFTEQELPTLPEYLGSPRLLVCARPLILFLMSFSPFSFGQCVICPFSIYEFWLHPLWYLQPLSYSNQRRTWVHSRLADIRLSGCLHVNFHKENEKETFYKKHPRST